MGVRTWGGGDMTAGHDRSPTLIDPLMTLAVMMMVAVIMMSGGQHE